MRGALYGTLRELGDERSDFLHCGTVVIVGSDGCNETDERNYVKQSPPFVQSLPARACAVMTGCWGQLISILTVMDWVALMSEFAIRGIESPLFGGPNACVRWGRTGGRLSRPGKSSGSPGRAQRSALGGTQWRTGYPGGWAGFIGPLPRCGRLSSDCGQLPEGVGRTSSGVNHGAALSGIRCTCWYVRTGVRP